MRSLSIALLLGTALLGTPAFAQDFAGAYTLPTPSGGVRLVLERGSGDQFTGTLAGNGSTGLVRARQEKDMLLGSVTLAGQPLFLRAWRPDGRLRVELAELDASGQPVWSTVRALDFEPDSAAIPAGEPRNPFARRPGENAGDPLAGQFAGDGVSMVLEGRDGSWSGRLEVDGEAYPVRVSGSPERLTGTLFEDGESFPFTGRLVGDRLTIESADGAFELRRAGAPAGANRGSDHPTRTESASRRVVINGKPLTEAELAAMESTFQVRVQAGDYWYDRGCGAWGLRGGPMLGAIPAGLELGGNLAANASGGGTGVFINGRELHPLDVLALQRLGPVLQGRYWVDAAGNGGVEGGPALFNLVELARRAGGRGGPWGHHSRYTDSHVGGDGQGFSYYMDKDVSWTSGD